MSSFLFMSVITITFALHFIHSRNLLMFIAIQKKKENIAEYLLYMWQIEDLARIKSSICHMYNRYSAIFSFFFWIAINMSKFLLCIKWSAKVIVITDINKKELIHLIIDPGMMTNIHMQKGHLI